MRFKEYIYTKNIVENDLMQYYFKGTITSKQLIKKAGGIDKVATKKDLEMAMNNNFLLSIQADIHDIDVKQIKKQIKKLLKEY